MNCRIEPTKIQIITRWRKRDIENSLCFYHLDFFRPNLVALLRVLFPNKYSFASGNCLHILYSSLSSKLLSFTRHILGRRLWTSALRLTLYGQFVAGETHKEIKETLQRLQHLGVRPLLAVPIEEDIGEEKEG